MRRRITVFRVPYLPGDTSPWIVLWNDGENALMQSFPTFDEAIYAAHEFAREVRA